MDEATLSPLCWHGDAETGVLRLLDQRALPREERWIECRTAQEVATAIQDMIVRGAPAIGLAGAYGMVLAARGPAAPPAPSPRAGARRSGTGAVPGPAPSTGLSRARDLLATARPTAVNLVWAVDKLASAAREDPSPARLLSLARALHEDDIAGNRRMAALGAARIESGMGVLTHCNAGALATGGIGTALGVLWEAHRQGKRIHVYADETRPRLQGARLTAWELSRRGIPHTLVCDGAAASLMARGRIQLVVTGADRIAANGDAANKIGTYSVAVNARFHAIPFHVAAPAATFDLALPDGRGIPIEERSEEEVTAWGGERTCPAQTHATNPAFDVTPAALIRSIFTDRGEVDPVGREAIARVLGSASR